LKVLVISATFPPVTSGGADYAFRLCQKLVAHGVEVHAITSQIEDIVSDPAVTTYPVMKSWNWSELNKLVALIEKVNPDVVNLHFGGFLYNDHPMITFLPTILKWKIPGIHFVTHIEAPIGCRVYLCGQPVRGIHRLITEFSFGAIDYSYGALLKDSDKVIVLSEEHGRVLTRHYSQLDKKMSLIPPPPFMPMAQENKHQARQRLQIGDDRLVLVYLGYLYPGKGIETLLAAFSKACAKRDNLMLFIIGGSPEMVLKNAKRVNYTTEMRDLAKSLNLADKVVFSGSFEVDSEMPSLYLRAADMAVMPWDWGVHLNNSSLGACAVHGLPIITTQSETSEKVFVHKENLYLCPPENPQAVASAIDCLIEDAGLREKLTAGALNLAQEWFSWDRAIDNMLELFGNKNVRI